MEKKKIVNDEVKLSYDDIVNIRKDSSEIKIRRENNKVLRFIAILIVVLAMVFGVLLLFHLI